MQMIVTLANTACLRRPRGHLGLGKNKTSVHDSSAHWIWFEIQQNTTGEQTERSWWWCARVSPTFVLKHNQLGFRNREWIVLGFEQNDVHCVHLHMYVVSGLVADSSCRHTVKESDTDWKLPSSTRSVGVRACIYNSLAKFLPQTQ